MNAVSWDARVRTLSAMNKRSLAAILRNHRRGTVIYESAPPEKWSHDELVSAVLREEFPVAAS